MNDNLEPLPDRRMEYRDKEPGEVYLEPLSEQMRVEHKEKPCEEEMLEPLPKHDGVHLAPDREPGE